ncbi:MAG TPA: bifunctional DNA-formamidopyrimidine glycosylase/DNA-(apurinic or apyrimidinic site) lyase [Bryobacteraceae bacterium]|nr:bifunctional DNA-formamidopyrimidine glycosylase/DNA-(apurinic or apyrimidinic site) lyase [Bryobacteraceae bacterium]
MPELPEVETIARALAPRLRGRRIVSAEFRCRRVLRGDPDETAASLAGHKVRAVRRHGKFIEIALDGGRCFVVHLGMTGKLLINGAPGKHTHAILTLDRGVLLYDDSRQFGRLELSEGLPGRVRALGPEPLDVPLAEFAAALRKRKTRIKALLLNQRFLRGIGNIYADEALFRAGIHPLAMAARLHADRVKKLHAAIRQVLNEAIEAGGSSVSDYVDVDGRQGSFQVRHNVYQKTGEACPRCGAAIRRILVAQRGTHFCPKCQKR